MRTTFILAALLACPLLNAAALNPRNKPKSNTWEKELKEIAAQYTKYGRVDQVVRWAPEDCRPPSVPTLRLSQSTEAATHGQKLYTIFAKQTRWDDGVWARQRTYLPPLLPENTEPSKKRGMTSMGQVIVKEAWVPVAVTNEERRADPRAQLYRGGKGMTSTNPQQGEHFGTIDYGSEVVPYAFNPKDQKHYKADRKAGLFIMFKLDPNTPDTDQGWVYGTVSADGQQVTAAGKIASCMKCHEQAPYDRLFGLKE